MSAALTALGDRIALKALKRARARAAAAIGAVPGVTAEIVDDGIVAVGKRLRARWLRDARLRWLGGWM